MWIVRLALRRPYTFVVLSMLITLLGIGSAIETPKDIFPYIDILVISIVWTYTGLTPTEMEGRVVTVVSPAAKWMTGASLRMDGGEIKGI